MCLKSIALKMSCAAVHRVRPFWPSHIALLLTLILSLSVTLQELSASPLPDLTQEYQNLLAEASTDNSTDSTTDNSTIAANTDVYVVKAVVYEIGILTDTDNTTSSESTERQESVDISLYDPPHS